MDQEQLKKKIGLILTDLNASAKDYEHADEINLGLFSAHAHYLFEHVNVLRKLVAEQEVKSEKGKVKREESQEPATRNSQPVNSQQSSVGSQQPQQLTTNNEQRTTNNPQPATIKQEQEQQQERVTPQPVTPVNERFKREQGTLNESIAKPIEKNISQLNSKPLTDLKTAIGINDKFLFINELFKGDKDFYAQVIDRISTLNSLTEANDYLKTTCAKAYNWEQKQDLVDRFYSILSRKFNV